MKRLIIILVAMAAMISTPATAQKGNTKYYGEVFVSGSAAKTDIHLKLWDMIIDGTPMMYGVSVQTIQGAKFGEYFSAGIGTGVDLLYGATDDFSLIAALIPVYADFKFWIPTNGKITPYLMAEAGGSFAIEPRSIHPLYGGGIGIKMTKRFAMSLNYIFDGYQIPNTEDDVNVDYRFKEHKVQLRFSWMF